MTFQTRNMFEKAWHNENSKMFQEQLVYFEESLWEKERVGMRLKIQCCHAMRALLCPVKLGTLS